MKTVIKQEPRMCASLSSLITTKFLDLKLNLAQIILLATAIHFLFNMVGIEGKIIALALSLASYAFNDEPQGEQE